jgi:hypothetical protein
LVPSARPQKDQLAVVTRITNTAVPPMTPSIIVTAAAALVLVAVFLGVRRAGRLAASRPVDAGAVSTRWLSELRRDEPWTRS